MKIANALVVLVVAVHLSAGDVASAKDEWTIKKEELIQTRCTIMCENGKLENCKETCLTRCYQQSAIWCRHLKEKNKPEAIPKCLYGFLQSIIDVMDKACREILNELVPKPKGKTDVSEGSSTDPNTKERDEKTHRQCTKLCENRKAENCLDTCKANCFPLATASCDFAADISLCVHNTWLSTFGKKAEACTMTLNELLAKPKEKTDVSEGSSTDPNIKEREETRGRECTTLCENKGLENCKETCKANCFQVSESEKTCNGLKGRGALFASCVQGTWKSTIGKMANACDKTLLPGYKGKPDVSEGSSKDPTKEREEITETKCATLCKNHVAATCKGICKDNCFLVTDDWCPTYRETRPALVPVCVLSIWKVELPQMEKACVKTLNGLFAGTPDLPKPEGKPKGKPDVSRVWSTDPTIQREQRTHEQCTSLCENQEAENCVVTCKAKCFLVPESWCQFLKIANKPEEVPGCVLSQWQSNLPKMGEACRTILKELPAGSPDLPKPKGKTCKGPK